MNQLIAVCSREEENGLVRPECQNLTGGIPDAEGVAICSTLDHIQQAAYIRFGIRYIVESDNLPDLIQQITMARIKTDEFRIDILRLTQHHPFHTTQAVLAAADGLIGNPNLDEPKRRYLIGVQEQRLWFGEVCIKPDRSFEKHRLKPYRTSSSLPAHLARALVNMVAPSARSILDPCCGTGSVLLEAQCLGLSAYGCDWNANMVDMARKNVAYYGYEARIEHMDACKYHKTADALITDLPYGKLLINDEGLIRRILANTIHLAPLAIFVAGEDISDMMLTAGYQDIEVFHIIRHSKYLRFIHHAHSRG